MSEPVTAISIGVVKLDDGWHVALMRDGHATIFDHAYDDATEAKMAAGGAIMFWRELLQRRGDEHVIRIEEL